ncbi:MAG: hypothetical protein K2L59_00765 [Muribaculaceae bacterium]|nr:hypothetical protein [Muribaculaceae bacterium]
MTRILRCIFLVASVVPLLAACNTVDDDRIPAMPVSINLSTPDLWTTYGVAGYGDYRLFIRELGEPRNFAYTAATATGYGGVLLISGVNPFTLEAAVPLAYDLSCPVERKPDIRVRIQSDGMLPFAVCPECGSRYDVVERAGSPVEGQALSQKLGLSRYECLLSAYGGYMIVNR